MSVKVENRPENRFGAFNTIETLRHKTVAAISSDAAFMSLSQHKFLEEQLLGSLLKLRTYVCTFNTFNVFNDEYSIRRSYHIKAINEANAFKSALELVFVLTHNSQINCYSEVLQLLSTLQAQLKTLFSNDASRNFKGKVQTNKEFREASKRDFYKEEKHDPKDIDPKVFDHNDPFGILDLTYVRPEASTEMPSDQPFE